MQINDRMRCARKKKNFVYQKANIIFVLLFFLDDAKQFLGEGQDLMNDIDQTFIFLFQ